MADRFDPISDDSPAIAKRRKLTHEPPSSRTEWSSSDDGAEEFTADDFQATATLPISTQQMHQLQYKPAQFHSDLNPSAGPRSSQTFTTQPTQTLQHTTQPTQPVQTASEVQVQCSSPAAPSPQPQKPLPAPMHRAPFAKPGGLLASAMAPPGTAFRRPPGVQRKPTPVNLEDSDEDPPVYHSDDEQSQPLKTNLMPASFKKAGRGLDSSPNMVQDSPRNSAPKAPTPFMAMMSSFQHQPRQPANDMASAYGSSSRQPRPQQQTGPAMALPPRTQLPPANAVIYNTLDEIPDYRLRTKVEQIRMTLGKSIPQCCLALDKKKGHLEDAMAWLADQDELSLSPVPIQRKGVAQATSPTSRYSLSESSQPIRPVAKQNVQAKRTIAEKYSAARKPSQTAQLDDSDDNEDALPQRKGRIIQGHRPDLVDSPPSSPPMQKIQPSRRLKNRVITIDSDESDAGVADGSSSEVEEIQDPNDIHANTISVDVREMREEKVLKLLNSSTVQDLAEITAKPEETIQFVLDQRPFNSLDDVRAVVQETLTKTGKKSKKTRAVGDQLVDECIEVMSGYDAVDELVAKCEKMAEPLRESLRAWGATEMDGELQLMKLDEAHDSGIGTPASSCAPDDQGPQKATKPKAKSKWIEQPSNMNLDLAMKDYQLVGLNWLHMLYKKEYSCILADDMGLGKTCQIIGFLSYLKLQEVDGVHLIIVPGSTLENWLREFERFAPNMNVRPYYGLQSERAELQYQIEQDWSEIDAIVTTYDMAVKKDDNKFLRHQGPWSVCVYDEAHMLRNPNSDRYSQLVRIGADFKVLLTGTPLQNNLQELIAILAFIMPDMFQEKREELDFLFKHKASTKDTSKAALLSSERIARARSMMTPFILRRKKQQVLDLPKKHSRVEYCDMTETQAEYYAELLEEAARFFAEKKLPGAKKSAKGSSNMIMTLRKAAIHPLLSRRLFDDKKLDRMVVTLSKSEEFGDNPPEKIRAYIDGEAAQSLKGGDFGLHKFCADRPYMAKRFALKKDEWLDSGKVVKFKELVTKYVKNGDRLLVFSQFTTLMDILEAVLETLNIKFMRLDGSTTMADRQEMIDKFYEDLSIPVFLLSTRAGGAGINLAAANKVIIFDSGFNPQDDIQAENRAHRVGQTREVEVVRLVSKNTIEEQIHALGESKLALDERVAGEGASAAETSQAEKLGEKLVEDMLVQKLVGNEEDVKDGKVDGKKEEEDAANSVMPPVAKATGQMDLSAAFKKGLEGKGLNVRSMQAQY